MSEDCAVGLRVYLSSRDMAFCNVDFWTVLVAAQHSVVRGGYCVTLDDGLVAKLVLDCRWQHSMPSFSEYRQDATSRLVMAFCNVDFWTVCRVAAQYAVVS